LGIGAHEKSIGLRCDPPRDRSLWIIDDHISRGTTLLAIERVVRKAGFHGRIYGITPGFLLEDLSYIDWCPKKDVALRITEGNLKEGLLGKMFRPTTDHQWGMPHHATMKCNL